MNQSPEYARYMIQRIGKDRNIPKTKTVSHKEIGPHILPGLATDVRYMLIPDENPFNLPEGIYVRTNRDVQSVADSAELQQRIATAALTRLRNPDNPEEPLVAHFDRQASDRLLGATFKIGVIQPPQP